MSEIRLIFRRHLELQDVILKIKHDPKDFIEGVNENLNTIKQNKKQTIEFILKNVPMIRLKRSLEIFREFENNN